MHAKTRIKCIHSRKLYHELTLEVVFLHLAHSECVLHRHQQAHVGHDGYTGGEREVEAHTDRDHEVRRLRVISKAMAAVRQPTLLLLVLGDFASTISFGSHCVVGPRVALVKDIRIDRVKRLVGVAQAMQTSGRKHGHGGLSFGIQRRT